MGGSVPRKKFHMTVVHQAICMSFLQPSTPFSMKEGILPLFDDLLADEVLLAMPMCNEYGIVGTTTINPPPAPRHQGDNQNELCPLGTLPLRIPGL